MSGYFSAFAESARRSPAAIAIQHPSATTAGTTTYDELVGLAEMYGTHLAATSADSGMVLILANRSAQSIAVSLGCLAAGRPFSWLNNRLKAPQLEQIIAMVPRGQVVADAPALMSLAKPLMQSKILQQVRWSALADNTIAGNAANLEQILDRLESASRIQTLPESSTPGELAGRGIAADDPGCCLFTSGSTGRQKGVLVSDTDLLGRARQEANWYKLGSGDRLLNILPFSFDVGLNQLLSGLISESTVVLHESWFARDLLRAIDEQQITGVSAVPAIWRSLLEYSPEDGWSNSFPMLRYLAVSGGSLSIDEQTKLSEIAGNGKIFKTYGQTETFRSASLPPEDLADKPGSVGRAYPGTSVTIIDEAGNQCRPGEIGELVHSGAGTMLGYLDSDNDTMMQAAGGKNKAISRQIRTGDYAYIDTDGYIFLKGRKDDLTKISGNRVFPDEVADQLRTFDVILEAEVLPVANSGTDASLCAFVVLNRGITFSERQLRRLASACLPAYMVPGRWISLPKMPRLVNGKTDRVTLFEQLK